MTTSTAPYTTTPLDTCKHCGNCIIGAVNQYCELCSVCLRAYDEQVTRDGKRFEKLVVKEMVRQRQQYGVNVGTRKNFPKIIVFFNIIITRPVEPLGINIVTSFPCMIATFAAYIADCHNPNVLSGDIPSGNIGPCTSHEVPASLASDTDETHVDPLTGSGPAFCS